MAGVQRPRSEWLALLEEPVLEPERRICDPHHHLWDRPIPGQSSFRYLADEYLADALSGHRVCASVLVESGARLRDGADGGAMYRASGPAELRSLGETEFLNGVGAMMRSGAYGPPDLCCGIVAYVDLRLGEEVTPVLERHARFERVRGIRNLTFWHPSPDLAYPDLEMESGMLADPRFRRGFAALASHGLSYDATALPGQIPELVDLARAFPQVTIVLNHLGGILGTGPYAGRRDEAFAQWRAEMTELATCGNVVVKIGGMSSPRTGFGLAERERPASSGELAQLWRPYFETCVALFGPRRCMFESNFPVDKRAVSYRTLWNAFKRLAADLPETDRDALFFRTARETYRLDLVEA